MEISFEVIAFYLLLVDSIGANLLSWSGGGKWYTKYFKTVSCYFPLTRGWTTAYLAIVLWIGYLLYKFGALTF